VGQAQRRATDIQNLFAGGGAAQQGLSGSVLNPAVALAQFQSAISRPEQQALISSLERAGQTQIAEALSGGTPGDLGKILGGLGSIGSLVGGVGAGLGKEGLNLFG
jgi:hypothetical protein